MYDVIVVGGRSAGSATGMLLARRGHRVLVVDRPAVPSSGGCVSVVSAAGMALLGRWGLAAPVMATGCPQADALTVTAGGQQFGGGGSAWFPSTSVLHELLRAAARRSGAEVRDNFTVRDVVWRDDRVAGIVGSGEDRHAVCDEARIVVGADGRQSVVARAATAPVLREQPSTTCCYSACWRDLDAGVPELHLRPGVVAAVLPGAEQVTCVTVAVPVEGWARYKRDPETTYLAALASLPPLASRLRQATRVGRFCGTADLAASVRQAVGPGWVLVGDAARHAGGIVPRSLDHAFVQADLAAVAVDDALVGRGPDQDGLAGYQDLSEQLLREVEDLTTELASWDAPPDTLGRRLGALEEATRAQLQRVETLHSIRARGSGQYEV